MSSVDFALGLRSNVTVLEYPFSLFALPSLPCLQILALLWVAFLAVYFSQLEALELPSLTQFHSHSISCLRTLSRGGVKGELPACTFRPVSLLFTYICM